MTPEALRTLIAGGESLLVEFKSDERVALNDRELVEAVVCLANRIGSGAAWLVVGVEDDTRVSGARARHGATTDVHKVAAMIAGRTRPPIAVAVESVSLDDRPLLVIEIPAQRHPVATSDGVNLRRTAACFGTASGRAPGMSEGLRYERAHIYERRA